MDNAGRACQRSSNGDEGHRLSTRVLGRSDLQGWCAVLALVERMLKVTLFDKNDTLLSRAAVGNEGKIHLGYIYASNPTLSTAKTMMVARKGAKECTRTSPGRVWRVICQIQQHLVEMLRGKMSRLLLPDSLGRQ